MRTSFLPFRQGNTVSFSPRRSTRKACLGLGPGQTGRSRSRRRSCRSTHSRAMSKTKQDSRNRAFKQEMCQRAFTTSRQRGPGRPQEAAADRLRGRRVWPRPGPLQQLILAKCLQPAESCPMLVQHQCELFTVRRPQKRMPWRANCAQARWSGPALLLCCRGPRQQFAHGSAPIQISSR